jgi:NAD(P)-dependent dehydrogenase (short-subunit alcohol dehydrogenase family)
LAAAESYFTDLKAPFLVTKLDVSKRPEVDAWIDSIVEKFGRLDGAVNSAGVIGKHHVRYPSSLLFPSQAEILQAESVSQLQDPLYGSLKTAPNQ